MSKSGANVSPEKKWNDKSLLEISTNARDQESIKYLIAYGADVNEQFKDGRTPVDVAFQEFEASKRTNWDLLNLLVDSSKLSKDSMDKAFMKVSCFFDKSSNDLFLKLIQKGADVNCFQGSPLSVACTGGNNSGGNLERVKMLLANGANPNICQNGWSPLMAAQGIPSSNQFSITKALLVPQLKSFQKIAA